RWPPTCGPATRTPVPARWRCWGGRSPACPNGCARARRRPGGRSRCAPTPGTWPGTWPAPPPRRTWPSRSARSGSPACGGARPGSRTTPGGVRPACRKRRAPARPMRPPTGPRPRRRRPLHPDQRALPMPELEQEPAIYACSFILTNLDVSTPARAAAAEHWYRHRTSIENIFRDSKHGAALRHLPSGDEQVNTAWMWASLIAAAIAAWLHQLTGLISGDQLLEGHGTRGGKAMIATLRRALILTPARLVSHGGQLIM